MTALNVSEKRLSDIDDQLNDPSLQDTITQREWEIISARDITEEMSDELWCEQWFLNAMFKYDKLFEPDRDEDGKKKKKKRQQVGEEFDMTTTKLKLFV